MASKHILGVVSVELSDIAGDGGVGTAFTAIGDTVRDSVFLTDDDPTVVDFNIEETDVPIESLSTPGKTKIAWSTNNLHPDTLIRLFGGTKSGTSPVIWTPPDTQISKEQSVRITDKKGNILTIVRATIAPKKNIGFGRSALAKLDISGTILTPTKAATPAYTLSFI